MASGIQHELASTKLILRIQPILLLLMGGSAVAVWLGYLQGFYMMFGWVGSFGYLFGLYVGRRVTPDLDIDEVGTRQTRRYRRRYRLLGRAWQIFWWPYAQLHVHRGVSHSPFIGTMGRWVYLFWLPVVFISLLLLEYVLFFWIHILFWVWVYAGQSSQDLLHIWMDR